VQWRNSHHLVLDGAWVPCSQQLLCQMTHWPAWPEAQQSKAGGVHIAAACCLPKPAGLPLENVPPDFGGLNRGTTYAGTAMAHCPAAVVAAVCLHGSQLSAVADEGCLYY
jgi:hypothetical protein